MEVVGGRVTVLLGRTERLMLTLRHWGGGAVAGQGHEGVLQASAGDLQVLGEVLTEEERGNGVGIGRAQGERAAQDLDVVDLPADLRIGQGAAQPFGSAGQGGPQGAAAHGGADLRGGAVGDEAPMTHQDDPVGEGVGLLKVVRGEDDGAPALGIGVDGLPEAAAPLDVHACGRLIEDEQCRIAHERHGEAQALLLASGALLDDARGEVGDAGAAHGLLCIDSMGEEARRQLHRLTHGDVGQEAGGLHDCGDQAPVGRLARAHPEDSRIAAGRAAQSQDHVDRRRLARTVGAQEGDDFAGADGQVDTVDGGDVTEGLVQIGQSDGV